MPVSASGTKDLKSNAETRARTAAAKSNSFGGINTSTVRTNSKTSSSKDSGNFGGINTSTIKTQDRGSSNAYGANARQGVSPGGGGLLGGSGNNNFGGINTGLLGSQTNQPSQLMQKAMDRSKANMLAKQYGQYRSGASNEYGAEDLSRTGFMADQYGQYRSPPAVNPMAPQMTQGQQDARVNAISRGPGSVAGVMPGAGPLSQQRTLGTLAGAMTEGGRPISPTDLQRLSATIAGEAGREGPMGQTAVANTMLNRMALADQGKAKYMGGGDINSLMSQYDATGMRKGTLPNQGFKNAQLGTDSLGAGIASIAGAASPNSQFNTSMPSNIKQATSFYNPRTANPNWGGDQFAALGNHVFGLPDELAGKGAMVTAARGMPGAQHPTAMARIDPAAATEIPQKPLTDTDKSIWETYAPDALQGAAAKVQDLANQAGMAVEPIKQMYEKYGAEKTQMLVSAAVKISSFLGPGPNGAVAKMGNDSNPNNDNADAMIAQRQQQQPQAPAAAPPINQAATSPQMQPWMYPQYSQAWAGLPQGIGGYARA
jgi:hypothetical protein